MKRNHNSHCRRHTHTYTYVDRKREKENVIRIHRSWLVLNDVYNHVRKRAINPTEKNQNRRRREEERKRQKEMDSIGKSRTE